MDDIAADLSLIEALSYAERCADADCEAFGSTDDDF